MHVIAAHLITIRRIATMSTKLINFLFVIWTNFYNKLLEFVGILIRIKTELAMQNAW